MNTKKAPAVTEAKEEKTIPNVSEISPLVKNPLKRLRLESGASPSTIIEAVQVNYPRFDMHLYARCERTSEYGVELCPDAFLLAENAVCPEMPKKGAKNDGHLLPCRVSCRLSAEEHARLYEVMKAKGYDTMQAFIGVLLRGVVKRFYKAEEKGEGK